MTVKASEEISLEDHLENIITWCDDNLIPQAMVADLRGWKNRWLASQAATKEETAIIKEIVDVATWTIEGSRIYKDPVKTGVSTEFYMLLGSACQKLRRIRAKTKEI